MVTRLYWIKEHWPSNMMYFWLESTFPLYVDIHSDRTIIFFVNWTLPVMREASPCHDALLPTRMAKMVLHWYMFDTRTCVKNTRLKYIHQNAHMAENEYQYSTDKKQPDVFTNTSRESYGMFIVKMANIAGLKPDPLYMYKISCILGEFSWHHFLTTLPLHDSMSPLFTDVTHCWLRLTYWSRDKMAASLQMIFLNAYSWMEMYEFRMTFHWNLFLGSKLIICQH